MKHEELAWVPMRSENGKSCFWQEGARDLQREARDSFVKFCSVDWSELRKEGWRIVRVRMTTELHAEEREG